MTARGLRRSAGAAAVVLALGLVGCGDDDGDDTSTDTTAAASTDTTAASDPILSLGSSQYGLVVKDENAWLQNPSEEARLVGEMAKLAKVQVKTTSMRGTSTSDEYALAGFGDAMKRAREECK